MLWYYEVIKTVGEMSLCVFVCSRYCAYNCKKIHKKEAEGERGEMVKGPL